MYIIRKNDLRILKFKRTIPDRDMAEYGRINDLSLISIRTAFEIMSKHDLLYVGTSESN